MPYSKTYLANRARAIKDVMEAMRTSQLIDEVSEYRHRVKYGNRSRFGLIVVTNAATLAMAEEELRKRKK